MKSDLSDFDTAIFGAEWDLSVALQCWKRYLEIRETSPEQATGYFLSAIAALSDAKVSLDCAELASQTNGGSS